MTNDKTREDFEAWVTKQGHAAGYGGDGVYDVWVVSRWWESWQAATQQSAARIAALEKHLQFVERWANHHGAKPHVTAKEALGVIQHYPPISAITRSYADGVVPDTFDPYARIAALEAERAEFLDASKVNLENYEFQRRKADAATATVYQFHYALKDAGWHPGRTDDKLTDIIRAKGAELAKLEAEVMALRKDAERWKAARANPHLLYERWEPIALSPDECDEAADAAIEAERGEG